MGDSIDKKQMKYVSTRIEGKKSEIAMSIAKSELTFCSIDLARNPKMHGHRFFAENGMATDDQIIMHCLRVYLQTKEPHIIPPLVPVSFMSLAYVYHVVNFAFYFLRRIWTSLNFFWFTFISHPSKYFIILDIL